MKKLLRTLFIIVLFLGVGFMYLVKNPDLPISQKVFEVIGLDMTSSKQAAIDPNCISYFDGCNTCTVENGRPSACTLMYCETMQEPQCLEYKWTGMDLTNCVSYFDGCNTCTVENGRPSACTLMYCETLAEPKCNEYASGANVKLNLQNCKSYFDGCNRCSVKNGQPDACTEMHCETPGEPKCLEYNDGTPDDNGNVGIANPASVNCEKNGGDLSIVTSSDGGQVGMCNFPDGSVCEERAYMRGECKPGENNDGGSVPGNSGDEPVACTMEYAPVCASVAVQCVKAPCPAIEQTFGNECMMNANKLAKFLHKGECKTK